MMEKQFNNLIDLLLLKVEESESLMKKYMRIKQPYEWQQNGIPQTGEF